MRPFLAVFLLVGCAGTEEEPAPELFSCDFVGEYYCLDYVGADWTAETAEAACDGTFQESGCSRTDDLGVCHREEGTGEAVDWRYYFLHPSSVTERWDTCEAAGGTWQGAI